MDKIKTRFKFKHFLFNKALRIMLITNGLILIAGAMLGPIYALYVQKVGGDLLDASLAGSVFALVAGITVLLCGRYSDKIKQKRLIVALGYVIIGIGFFLYTLVDSIVFLLVVQMFIGLGEALYNPPFDAIYSEHLDEGHFSTEWGAWEATNYFTTALGAILGGVIVTKFGFNPLFIIMSILCLTSAFYIYFLPRKVL
jgi:MFS family permease